MPLSLYISNSIVTWLCRYNESIELNRYLVLFKDPKWALHVVTLMLRSAVRAAVQFIPCDQICKFAREVCEGGQRWPVAAPAASREIILKFELDSECGVRTVNPRRRRSITKFTKNEINKEQGGGILDTICTPLWSSLVKVDLFWYDDDDPTHDLNTTRFNCWTIEYFSSIICDRTITLPASVTPHLVEQITNYEQSAQNSSN